MPAEEISISDTTTPTTVHLVSISYLKILSTTKVNELLETAKDKVVLIKADEEVEYGAVMSAMDQLRQAGIEDIGLITDPKAANSSTGAH